jgi:hypothetical protein
MRAAAAGQWLDRVAEAGPRRASLSVLWSDAAPARAALFAGPPSPDALAYLLAGAAVDGVYDLGAASPAPAPA